MNKTFKFVCVAFVAVAACACNRKDADTVSFGREMSFSAVSESIVKSGEVVPGDTLPSNEWKIYATATQYRADGVLISADYFNGPREFSTADAPITPASQYTSSPASYWPAGEGWMNFLVYSVPASKKSIVQAEYPVSNATDKVTFTWDTYTEQVDLLYGCRNDVSYSPSSVETVNFNFKHAQAVIVFSVKTGVGRSVTIDSIVIDGLKVKGTFTVDNTKSYLNGSWSELESVVGENSANKSAVTVQTENFSIVPATRLLIPEQESLPIKVCYQIDGIGGPQTKYITEFAGNWKKGKEYIYQLDFSL